MSTPAWRAKQTDPGVERIDAMRGAINALDERLRAVLEGKIRRWFSCGTDGAWDLSLVMLSLTRAAIKKRRLHHRTASRRTPMRLGAHEPIRKLLTRRCRLQPRGFWGPRYFWLT